MRKYHLNKKPIYPFDEWAVVEDGFLPEYNHRQETIFALGNGYLGLRGTFEEGISGDSVETTPGTYINGVYESEEIQYGEFVYGMPKWSQSMVNLADWKTIRLNVEDEWFDMWQGQVESYRRVLDLRSGILSRSLIWTGENGRKVKIEIKRCISLTDQHKAVISFTVTPLNFSGKMEFVSELNGDVRNFHYLRERALEVKEITIDGELGYLQQETRNSQIAVGFAMEHRLVSSEGDLFINSSKKIDGERIVLGYDWDGKEGVAYTLDKFVSVYTSLDCAKEKIKENVYSEVKEAKERGVEHWFGRQAEFLHEYWDDADVEIKGDPALQQGVRFNAFQLLQSCGRNGRTSIGAKGLTGEHYEGHYFWDTEVYINPFFLYSQPEVVKQLLLYRYSTLDCARARARVMRNKGALYAWRTINGNEASAFFEGSTAQYHINAAIIYAVHRYVEATDDLEFLVNYGAEMLFETARLWADRGGFVPMKGNKFCINEVCGPDEYKSGVNNNCYTNYMARFNLQFAVKVAGLLEKSYPQEYGRLMEKINLSEDEVRYWKRCYEQMYLPYNDELGIHPQDDSFLYKEDLDVDSLPEEEIPLVRNWHPLNIWRYQICKQADVILLMFLQGDLFDQQVKKRNYDYYEPRTTHDSSLSSCIFSIIATEIGYEKQAYDYFMQTVRLDLDDYNNNAHEGIHAACMAGSWLGVTHGFAGMRVYEGVLNFKPYLPAGWESYQFSIRFKGRKLRICVSAEGVKYSLVEGGELEFYHNGEKVRLVSGEVSF